MTEEIIEVYENERWYLFFGWSSTLLPTDRWHFSSMDGKVEFKHDFRQTLTPPEYFKWSSDWMLLSSDSGGGDVGEGWTYALDFPGTYSSTCGRLKFVRRRCWCRKARSDFSPLQLAELRTLRVYLVSPPFVGYPITLTWTGRDVAPKDYVEVRLLNAAEEAQEDEEGGAADSVATATSSPNRTKKSNAPTKKPANWNWVPKLLQGDDVERCCVFHNAARDVYRGSLSRLGMVPTDDGAGDPIAFLNVRYYRDGGVVLTGTPLESRTFPVYSPFKLTWSIEWSANFSNFTIMCHLFPEPAAPIPAPLLPLLTIQDSEGNRLQGQAPYHDSVSKRVRLSQPQTVTMFAPRVCGTFYLVAQSSFLTEREDPAAAAATATATASPLKAIVGGGGGSSLEDQAVVMQRRVLNVPQLPFNCGYGLFIINPATMLRHEGYVVVGPQQQHHHQRRHGVQQSSLDTVVVVPQGPIDALDFVVVTELNANAVTGLSLSSSFSGDVPQISRGAVNVKLSPSAATRTFAVGQCFANGVSISLPPARPFGFKTSGNSGGNRNTKKRRQHTYGRQNWATSGSSSSGGHDNEREDEDEEEEEAPPKDRLFRFDLHVITDAQNGSTFCVASAFALFLVPSPTQNTARCERQLSRFAEVSNSYAWNKPFGNAQFPTQQAQPMPGPQPVLPSPQSTGFLIQEELREFERLMSHFPRTQQWAQILRRQRAGLQARLSAFVSAVESQGDVAQVTQATELQRQARQLFEGVD